MKKKALSLALAALAPQMALIPALVSFGSLLGYYAYLNMRYLLPMRYGACALALAMLVTVFCLASTLYAGEGEGEDTGAAPE